MSTFGSRLRVARERADISQETLAVKVDVTLQTIYRYEKDAVEPKMNAILRIAEVLDCDLQWLIAGDPSGEDEPDTSALDTFLETRLGKTATPEEVRTLRSLKAFTGRPTPDTFSGMLVTMRGTIEPNKEVAARAEATGAMRVKRGARKG